MGHTIKKFGSNHNTQNEISNWQKLVKKLRANHKWGKHVNMPFGANIGMGQTCKNAIWGKHWNGANKNRATPNVGQTVITPFQPPAF